ncbi:hypothetical protein [Devosia sp.]|uniref:hypothetical protein n=1 Tax=Devosia sp. TaxID=1871048 RepID=UPI001B055FFA|nr:hypothetical protein [Devosia sp.]MBO9589079.1 hypothetical protein [Devosia sp.]
MDSVKLLLFRLNFDAGYDRRWQSLNDVIAEIAPRRWDQGTASFLFHHPNTVGELLAAVKARSSIHLDGRDMVMILDLSTHLFAQIGVADPQMLANVMASPTWRRVA